MIPEGAPAPTPENTVDLNSVTRDEAFQRILDTLKFATGQMVIGVKILSHIMLRDASVQHPKTVQEVHDYILDVIAPKAVEEISEVDKLLIRLFRHHGHQLAGHDLPNEVNEAVPEHVVETGDVKESTANQEDAAEGSPSTK